MMTGFGEVAERLRRSTVRVECCGREAGGGSGVIRTEGGLIVTNAHVARTGRPSVELWDGRRFAAEVTARDLSRDLALLRIGAAGLPAAEFGDSASLRPGEIVVAVGNPLGFTGAVSTGVVHSVGPIRGMGRHDWVRASVRLAPGNSGGPLADARGRVVGINTAIVHGLGVAVPGDAVETYVHEAMRPRLGLSLRPAPQGLMVVGVAAASPAANASIWVGDILVAAGGRRLRDAADLGQAIDEAGGVLHLDFLRGDRSRTRRASVQLGATRAEAA
jgi:serine protease Do